MRPFLKGLDLKAKLLRSDFMIIFFKIVDGAEIVTFPDKVEEQDC